MVKSLSDLKVGDIFYLVDYNGWNIVSVLKTKVEYYTNIKLGRIIHYKDTDNKDCCFTLHGENYLDNSIITYSHSNFYKTKCFLKESDVIKELDNYKIEFNNRYNKLFISLV